MAKMARKLFIHYLALVGAIALGAILRFWNLDLKPLWLDEVITALFSLGQRYNDVPLEVVFSLDRLPSIFTFKPAVTCSQIAYNVATQSTHPPLFFCLMHSWVGWISSVSPGWVWTLRSLPALFGVGAIAAIYCVNARAFSPAAGLMASFMMAVSPFAVYLSQEARHYTLPLLLIALALWGLIEIQRDLFLRQKLRPSVWLGWAIVNSIGLYVHYFFILTFIASLGTLLGLMYWRRHTLPRNTALAASLTISGVVLSFMPWLPMLLSNFSRSETSWVPRPHDIAPLYQTLANWVLIVIALPVENQPLWIAVPAGVLMVLFAVWVAWHVFRGFKQLWCTPATYLSTLTLASFTVLVLLEFFTIVYLLGKDITVVPRYNFVYYPSFCALIGASLVKSFALEMGRWGDGERVKFKSAPNRAFYLLFFTFSFLSCVLVVYNLAFQKPFYPERVAQDMNQEPSVPLMVVVGYRDYQDLALGLSFGLALEKIRSESSPATEFAFFNSSSGYESVWQKLSQLPLSAESKLNLWIVAPGLKRRDYPPQLARSRQTTCTIDPTQHYRIGVPYQLYRCNLKVQEFKLGSVPVPQPALSPLLPALPSYPTAKD